MNRKSEEIERTLAAAAARLVARATDTYLISAETLLPRISAAVGKYLLRNAESTAADINDFVDKLQADDLCLIVACEQGNETAWADLVERFGSTVRSAARSVSANEEGAEDLAQSIWAELHGLRLRQDGKPASKLAYYSGRGSLAGWLRAVVGQLAVDQHRKQSRLVQTEDDSDFDRLIQKDEQQWSGHGERLNPEVEVSDKRASADLQKALAASIGELSDEDRLLVKLYYFDGLKLREAGAILGVHEATASRRLTRIHADLRNHVEQSLKEDHGWTRPETEQAFSDIALHLEADIEPLLVTETLIENESKMTG